MPDLNFPRGRLHVSQLPTSNWPDHPAGNHLSGGGVKTTRILLAKNESRVLLKIKIKYNKINNKNSESQFRSSNVRQLGSLTKKVALLH